MSNTDLTEINQKIEIYRDKKTLVKDQLNALKQKFLITNFSIKIYKVKLIKI